MDFHLGEKLDGEHVYSSVMYQIYLFFFCQRVIGRFLFFPTPTIMNLNVYDVDFVIKREVYPQKVLTLSMVHYYCSTDIPVIPNGNIS